MRTADLIGPALDWAVAKCEGVENPVYDFAPAPGDKDFDPDKDYSDFFYISGPTKQGPFNPSENWSQGGPIIERERIVIDTEHGDPWRARFGRARITFDGRAHHYHHQDGPTPLIAAMRCFAVSRLGEDVEIPEELL